MSRADATPGVAPHRLKVAIDCRFIDDSGIGTATRLILEALRDTADPRTGTIDWILVATRPIDIALPNSRLHLVSPRSARGWRRFTIRFPGSDVAIFPSPLRPLTRTPSIQVVHDIIPIQVASGMTRIVKRQMLRATARNSSTVLSGSTAAARDVQHEFGLKTTPAVLSWPVDVERAQKIRSRRSALASDGSLLFVGRFAPHKNLERLVEAFAASGWSSGPLVLAGTSDPIIEQRVREIAGRLAVDLVVTGRLSDDGLLDCYARARAVVLPSLYEGFGLPVQEAWAAGIPVLASTGVPGADGLVPEELRFDPRSVPDMARAIGSAITHNATLCDQAAAEAEAASQGNRLVDTLLTQLTLLARYASRQRQERANGDQ